MYVVPKNGFGAGNFRELAVKGLTDGHVLYRKLRCDTGISSIGLSTTSNRPVGLQVFQFSSVYQYELKINFFLTAESHELSESNRTGVEISCRDFIGMYRSV
jgi:hypothetical protein